MVLCLLWSKRTCLANKKNWFVITIFYWDVTSYKVFLKVFQCDISGSWHFFYSGGEFKTRKLVLGLLLLLKPSQNPIWKIFIYCSCFHSFSTSFPSNYSHSLYLGENPSKQFNVPLFVLFDYVVKHTPVVNLYHWE